MNPTITTEELLALTKSADLLRRTAEKAMRFDEAERLLTEHIRSWERLQNAMPEDDYDRPLVERVVQRLGLVDALKEEVVTASNHAACRLNVLGEIHRILGSDGGTTGVCALTGVPPQLYRLPKRVEQLVGELHGTRNDRDHLAGILEKVARACDGDDPLDFPQLPQKVAELVKQAEQCQSWRDEFVKAENKANRAEERANSAGLQVIALSQELEGVRANLTRMDERVGELLRENAAVKDAHHAMWKRLQLVEGENETLARNMPPEPPTETALHAMQDRIVQKTAEAWLQDTPVVRTYDPACFRTTKNLGQAWCRLKPGTYSPALAVLDMPPNDLMVLCEVHMDTTTGALTYHPVAVKDLPLAP